MKMINLLIIVPLLFACSEREILAPPPPTPPPSYALTVDLSDEQQTIHSFGASDCWTAKFIGDWTDEAKKNRVADLLFSTDTLNNGSPEGIGLSLWRFNIGAGSFEQGEESMIRDEWRREESFQDASGNYDWSKQSGQQWFLQAARQRGIDYTLGFSISAPVHMTKNGKAFSPGGDALNIEADKMEEFATFLADVAAHFQFDYLSPVNEPQWAWKAGDEGTASQEGTPAQNQEIATLARLLSPQLAEKSPTTQVTVAEAAQLDFLYGRNDSGRGNQIERFFDASSDLYLGDLPQVAPVLAAHSYFTTCPNDNLISVRQQVVAQVRQADVPLDIWQTEFGILGNICDQYSGYPRNTSMDYGLYVAKVLHHDLAITNVTSWQWWLAMSPYDYSDALVYIDAPGGGINVENSKDDGEVLDSKQLWSFGNFARFVRPGMVRISATLEGLEQPIKAAGSHMVTAYKDPEAKRLVLVFVNVSTNETTLPVGGVNIVGNRFNVYTTSGEKNLEKSVVTADSLTLEPRSVMTFVGRYE